VEIEWKHATRKSGLSSKKEEKALDTVTRAVEDGGDLIPAISLTLMQMSNCR
jgi:hypothetical protein